MDLFSEYITNLNFARLKGLGSTSTRRVYVYVEVANFPNKHPWLYRRVNGRKCSSRRVPGYEISTSNRSVYGVAAYRLLCYQPPYASIDPIAVGNSSKHTNSVRIDVLVFFVESNLVVVWIYGLCHNSTEIMDISCNRYWNCSHLKVPSLQQLERARQVLLLPTESTSEYHHRML